MGRVQHSTHAALPKTDGRSTGLITEDTRRHFRFQGVFLLSFKWHLTTGILGELQGCRRHAAQQSKGTTAARRRIPLERNEVDIFFFFFFFFFFLKLQKGEMLYFSRNQTPPVINALLFKLLNLPAISCKKRVTFPRSCQIGQAEPSGVGVECRGFLFFSLIGSPTVFTLPREPREPATPGTLETFHIRAF